MVVADVFLQLSRVVFLLRVRGRRRVVATSPRRCCVQKEQYLPIYLYVYYVIHVYIYICLCMLYSRVCEYEADGEPYYHAPPHRTCCYYCALVGFRVAHTLTHARALGSGHGLGENGPTAPDHLSPRRVLHFSGRVRNSTGANRPIITTME